MVKGLKQNYTPAADLVNKKDLSKNIKHKPQVRQWILLVNELIYFLIFNTYVLILRKICMVYKHILTKL